ncbi:DUF5518 domain-containing protein [Haladaptatus sp. DFWS20]|uniref:DUF5518 domain-containing protein n=1 Tax=Haladaptatus sp. DFWS20 TaxID=3403467 RepID=UPI003EBD170C
MTLFRNLRRDLRTPKFRTAVLLGIISMPFMIVENLTSDPASAMALFVACVISGYLYEVRSVPSTQAGAVTGFIGGLPVALWQSWSVLIDWWAHPMLLDAVGDSWLVALLSVVAAVLTGAILIGILLWVGKIGGLIGEWLRKRVGTARLSNAN